MSRVLKSDQTDAKVDALASLAQAGDVDALQELLRVTRPFLISLIRKEGYNDDQREEQEAAATLGLWEAVTRWDPEHPKGKTFKLVAWYRMRHHIDEWCARNSGAIPMPRAGAWSKGRQIDEEIARYASEHPGTQFPEDALGEEELDAITGVRNTRAILRARSQSMPVMEDDGGADASAEAVYMAHAAGDFETEVVAYVAWLTRQWDNGATLDQIESLAEVFGEDAGLTETQVAAMVTAATEGY